jgi:hypothetical protein
MSLSTPRARPFASVALAVALALAALVGAALLPATQVRGTSLPPVPSRWPSSHFELGLTSSPGTAASIRSAAPFRFRYQYLAGGVNTGQGWATWNSNGSFVTNYIAESAASGMVSVFPYYQMLQSNPQTNLGEAGQDLAHLNDASVMSSYWADVRLFFQRAAGSQPVVLHIEPDLWGYVEQASAGNDASTVPARVGSLGVAELAGLPDTAAGFAQGFIRFRDALAPNVVLAYHLSDWGTGIDLHWSQTDDVWTDQLAQKAAAFYRSLGAVFDVTFADISDRDAGFKQAIYGAGPEAWWMAADNARWLRFIRSYSAAARQRVVVWQIPLGNTIMRALNDTWGHFQDNRPQFWLDDPANGNLAAWRDAGVLALLFGGGASGTTCACDATGDGVTDPAAINGNTRLSYSADDDGGYFKNRAAAYYAGGSLPLDGSGPGPTPTPTATPAPSATPTPSPTPAPTPAPVTWTTAATVSPSKVRAGSGQAFTVTTSVRASGAATALVDVELYDPKGNKVMQTSWDNQAFATNVTRTFAVTWSAPSAPTGIWRLKVGVFGPGWGPMLAWNNNAANLSVTRK